MLQKDSRNYYSSGATEFTYGFSGVRVDQVLVFLYFFLNIVSLDCLSYDLIVHPQQKNINLNNKNSFQMTSYYPSGA
jgi:hypothetical protein